MVYPVGIAGELPDTTPSTTTSSAMPVVRSNEKARTMGAPAEGILPSMGSLRHLQGHGGRPVVPEGRGASRQKPLGSSPLVRETPVGQSRRRLGRGAGPAAPQGLAEAGEAGDRASREDRAAAQRQGRRAPHGDGGQAREGRSPPNPPGAREPPGPGEVVRGRGQGRASKSWIEQREG